MKRSRSYKRALLLGVTVLVSGAATFMIATALGAIEPSHEHPDVGHTGGPVTPRAQIAVASSVEFGRFRILRSEDAAARECLGVELKNVELAGDVMLGEHCGPANAAMDLATLNGRDETIIYGRVPSQTDRVLLDETTGDRVGTAKSVAALTPEIRGRFVVHVVPAGRTRVTATAVDADANELQSVDLPLPGR